MNIFKIFFIAFTFIPSFSVLAGGTYNPTLAVLYAQTWTSNKDGEKRNPNYRSFDSDCTNLFSQSMRAGGLTDDKVKTKNWLGQIINDYLAIGSWYHITSLSWWDRNPSSSTFSNTWSIANSHASRLKSGFDSWKYVGVYDLKNTSNIMVEYGDAIFAQWDPKKDTNINHAMLVTGFRKVGNAYEPRLTYHSTDRLNRSFTDFRSAALAQSPNTKIYVYRRVLRSSVPASWQIF